MKRFCVFLFFLTAGLAFAQDGDSMKWKYNASFRSRLEIWDWFKGDANHNYAYSGNHFRFAFGQTSKKVDWSIDLAAPFILGAPNDAAAPAPQGGLGLGANYYGSNKKSRNSVMIFPKQAFVNLKGLGGAPQSVKLGRFDFAEGMEAAGKNPVITALKRTRIQQRLIGSFGWSHVGRSYNGFHYSYNPKNLNITFAGAVPSRGVFQVDGWGVVKVGFGYLAATKPYTSGNHSGEVRGFGIFYQDWRRIGKTDNRPGAVRGADRANVQVWSFGGHFLHAAKTGAGTFDFLFWGVGQTGNWGAQSHSGNAIAVEGGFQPKGLDVLKPWIRGGYTVSSGDDNPTDDKHNTFFQILPTPRIYARTPFFNMMNLNDMFAELVLRPHKKLTIRTDVHGLRLAKSEDLWYAGGGAFNPWVFGYAGRPSLGGRGLATLYDVSVDVAATKNLTLSGYYGYANGKSVMAAIYPNGKNMNFAYLELVYKFGN
jgi:alginate export protein